MQNKKLLIAFASILIMALSWPPKWYPNTLKLWLAENFFTPAYTPPLPSKKSSQKPSIQPAQKSSSITASQMHDQHGEAELDLDLACPEDLAGWRKAQRIGGVDILETKTCVADNPYAVAVFVKGSNNVSNHILMQSGITADAIEKGADLDGDGDPDEIHIRLEVVELNGPSPEIEEPTTQYAVAPDITPGLWVFAPKTLGMATENFESLKANALLRLPSPAIRIEQGDRVRITLENTHYMPHTIHFHGVDHAFVDANGEGNDGVPIASEKPVMPGMSRTYDINPRQPGTMFYHCHVQPQVHVMMGLQGLFIVEENRPNNWVQTLNIGSGQVRSPSVIVRERYDREYDLHYHDLDKELGSLAQSSNDPRVVTRRMHREYNITETNSDYFVLNGKSFPYTFQDSLLYVKENENIKLRVVNGGTEGIALHTHGHKLVQTHADGVAIKQEARPVRDVFWLASAQRADFSLQTTNNGLHSYGPGIWLFHDHQGKMVTTDGIAPGGHISAIVYDQYLNERGWPKTQGISWKKFFDSSYYQRKIPVWESYSPDGKFSDIKNDIGLQARLLIFALALGIFLGLLFASIIRSIVRN